MIDEQRVAAGMLTGFVVGVTGVGGGALMTPILLMFFGTAPLTAIGTDLWFAAITKLAMTSLHQRARLIDWQIVRRLWSGSLPGSAVTLVWMALQPSTLASIQFLRGAVAAAVCLTAFGMAAQKYLHAAAERLDLRPGTEFHRWQHAATIVTGILLGVLVTLTSVGAGALGAVCLWYLYPTRLTPPRLVATDVAHAIPLALFAGAGHLTVGHVDTTLLRDLLIGSVPAAIAGAFVSSRLPHAWLRVALAAVLLVIGVRLALGA
jgi:uncharacterized membrane protein YfcA